MLRNAKKPKEPKEHYGMPRNAKKPYGNQRMLRNTQEPQRTLRIAKMPKEPKERYEMLRVAKES